MGPGLLARLDIPQAYRLAKARFSPGGCQQLAIGVIARAAIFSTGNAAPRASPLMASQSCTWPALLFAHLADEGNQRAVRAEGHRCHSGRGQRLADRFAGRNVPKPRAGKRRRALSWLIRTQISFYIRSLWAGEAQQPLAVRRKLGVPADPSSSSNVLPVAASQNDCPPPNTAAIWADSRRDWRFGLSYGS